MEEQQYAKIIDSIPTFSGEPQENIHDWLDIISLKFEIIGYDSRQKRRFIPQYLAGNALKWHLAHREGLATWEGYIVALESAFPRISTTSRDMNLKMLRDRKQGDTEAFTGYYTSVVALCHKHDSAMADLQIIDWLKAGMNLKLYERLQGEEFTTPQALLVRAQRVELDTAVLDARKRECTLPTPVISSTPPIYRPKRWDQPTSYQLQAPSSYASSYQPTSYQNPQSSSSYTLSYPPPLMSTPYSIPSYNTAPRFPTSFHTQSSSDPYSSFPVHDSSMRFRRPVVCYSCGQTGHISPHCPSRPKE